LTTVLSPSTARRMRTNEQSRPFRPEDQSESDNLSAFRRTFRFSYANPPINYAESRECIRSRIMTSLTRVPCEVALTRGSHVNRAIPDDCNDRNTEDDQVEQVGTTCWDSRARVASPCAPRVELMMRVGRVINHTFITRIAAAPH